MIHNFENTERCEDNGGNTQKLGNSKLASPPLFIFTPISLRSPSINYIVYPFESFTFSRLTKCLVVGKLNLFTFISLWECMKP